MAVAEHHVAVAQAVVQAAEQGQLARLFALVRAKGGIKHRADRQRKDHDETKDREAHARLLVVDPRVGPPVGGRVGHADRRPAERVDAVRGAFRLRFR